MAIDPLSIATAAGISALSPVVAKGIGSLFGLDEPSEEEQRASRLRQEALDRLTAQAEGRTASPAQLAALAQQQRTQQALQSLAQRGTVQQRAGNVRAAMQAAPEVMAQQGAVAAQTRAAEMESARNALAQMQMASASQEAAAGRANREYMQRLIGAGVSGGAGAAASAMMQGGGEPADQNKLTEEQANQYNLAREVERLNRRFDQYKPGPGAPQQQQQQAQQQRQSPAAPTLGQTIGQGVQDVSSQFALGIKRAGQGIGQMFTPSLKLGRGY